MTKINVVIQLMIPTIPTIDAIVAQKGNARVKRTEKRTKELHFNCHANRGLIVSKLSRNSFEHVPLSPNQRQIIPPFSFFVLFLVYAIRSPPLVFYVFFVIFFLFYIYLSSFGIVYCVRFLNIFLIKLWSFLFYFLLTNKMFLFLYNFI